MITIHALTGLLLTYTMAACATVVTAALAAPGAHRSRGVLASFVAVVLGATLAALAQPGRNIVVQTALLVARFDRATLAAIVAGSMAGLLAGWALRLTGHTVWGRAALGLCHLAAAIGMAALVARDAVSPYLSTPDSAAADSGLIERDAAPGFRLEVVHQLSCAPTSLALDGRGRLHVAGYAGLAFQNGVVLRLDRPAPGAAYLETPVADYLNRPHGLAFLDGDLYISRAGQYTRAVGGKIQQQNTGAVTRCRDLDGDGSFDHFEDVLADLPGAQQPDGLHQNNGIAFDNEGSLFVTVGMRSDHGPAAHPYEGTILRLKRDDTQPVVFARGLRNPYDLTFGPGESLFCTDNDDNSRGAGDELNLIVEGGHYGHPYAALDSIAMTSTRPPLLKSKSALEGLAYAPPGSLPTGYDDCLYVASYGDGHVNRIRVNHKGGDVVAVMDVLARVPGVVDLVIAVEEQAIYACSHDERKLYRITAQ